MKIVALSDSRGGIYVPDGIPDIDAVERCRASKGFLAGCYCTGSVCDATVQGAVKGEDLLPHEVLELPAHVVVPAALENTITLENAPRIKAPFILEMANGPTTQAADAALSKRGTVLIPDILANAGGVTASYFEWQQNMAGEHWAKEKVLDRLKTYMEDAAARVFEMSQGRNVSLREGAYLLALRRLDEVPQDTPTSERRHAAGASASAQ